MLTTILRRGGAWRIAALGLFAASLSLGALTAPRDTANAHEGAGLCGTGYWPTATFWYMWDDWQFYPGAHYHRWIVVGGGIHDEFCYLIY
ncbi:MAG: hypothetical protein ACRDHF_01785 [Tepidiformaceae bacterium]